MMIIFDPNRHFYSDCQNRLKRLYKDYDEIRGLLKLRPNSEHLKFSMTHTKNSIDQWERHANEAWKSLEMALKIWSNWQSFERRNLRESNEVEMRWLNWAVIF